jgi:hypothetical protein
VEASACNRYSPQTSVGGQKEVVTMVRVVASQVLSSWELIDLWC